MSDFKNKVGEFFGVTGIVVFFVAIILFFFILGPWLLFWSVETIAVAAGFAVTIPLTFKTWLAAVVLLMLLRGGGSRSSS